MFGYKAKTKKREEGKKKKKKRKRQIVFPLIIHTSPKTITRVGPKMCLGINEPPWRVKQ
jgi:hypothetical protein